jgi:hypothetical protein
MKTKIFLSFFLLGLLYLVGCDDSINSIGVSIQPDEDKISVISETADVEGETQKMGAIYAKSITGLLGEFYDSQFGSLKAGYACQYYPSVGFVPDSMVNENEIDSIKLHVIYTSYFGDSLAPMEVSVYPVIKSLEKNYYTDVDPAQFCDMNSLLGKQSYTARDLNVSDSANLANSRKVLSVSLPKELGQKFLEEYKKTDHGAYASPSAMAEFFPGTYLMSTFGNGCLLNAEETSIYIYYKRNYTIPGVLVEDSLITATSASVLNITKELIQLNTYTSRYDDDLLNNKDVMYLKTPAGLCAQITVPVPKIVEAIGNKKISSIKLDIGAYPKEDREYVLNFPGLGTQIGTTSSRSKLLLIEPDSVKTFFEEQKVANDITGFFSTFNSSTYSYTFENISNVVQNAIDKAREKNQEPENLKLLILPVQVSYYTATDSYSYTTYPVDQSSSHYLYPSAVALKKEMKIEVIAAGLQ